MVREDVILDETNTEGDDELTAVRRERDELHDRLLRAAAEFDNYRKRTERERREWSDAAATEVVQDLLPAIDDLERALAATSATPDRALRDGVVLIHRQLLDALRRRGVQPIDAIGQPFDPQWHESVASEPAGDRPDGEITDEIRRGYRIGDRLVRPAMVKVAKA